MKRSCVAVSSPIHRLGPWIPLALAVVIFTFTACGGGSTGVSEQLLDQAVFPNSATDAWLLPPTRAVTDGAFATSPVCADCHANRAGSDAMRDEEGRPIAPYDLWRSTLMSGAVRDPFFRAVVSAEMAAAPTMADAIEAKCLSCHGPMASREGALDGVDPTLDMVYEDTDRSQLLLDGVACTLCHQITDEGLGTEDSFSGGFELNAEREIYGPHARPRVEPMLGRSGYRPVRASHNTESSLCGSCHTLITEALDANGDPTNMAFTEQTAYLEWQNSVFSDEVETPDEAAASCQDCHLPTVDEDGAVIETAIASVHGMSGRGFRHRWRRGARGGGMNLDDRSPYGRHLFVGGNTAVLTMLLDNFDVLSPNASSAGLQATIAASRDLLRNATARLTLDDATRVDDEIHVRLLVESFAGHKLPTGIPSRRMWLRVRLLDGDDEVVFESGGYDALGRILGGDGTPLASEAVAGPVETHRDVIDDEDEVQIYEQLMEDSDGLSTWRLMRAATHLKDNRLLPLGWSDAHPDASRTQPHGGAEADSSFTAGEDTVTYEILAPASEGPYRLEACLLYQAISERFAAELLQYSTDEIDEFADYFTPAVRAPEVIDTLSEDVP